MNGHSHQQDFGQNLGNYGSQYMNNYNQNQDYSQSYYGDLNTNQTFNKPNVLDNNLSNYNMPNNYIQGSIQDHTPQLNQFQSQLPQVQMSNPYIASSSQYSNNQIPTNSAFHSYNQLSFNPQNVQMNNISNLQNNSIANQSLPVNNNFQSPSMSPYQNFYNNKTNNPDLSENFKSMQLNSSQDSTIDLMQKRNLFTQNCNTDFPNGPKTHYTMNCDPKIMQCTLNTIPVETNMLTKSRLPLGVHIQPFRDSDIVTVSINSIVRCRPCRTYINPFVTLIDNQRRWQCNVCGKVNDIPDEFMYDPSTKTYGNPSQRPELKYCNIEYTANPEYTIRPPMSTTYIFLLDVSKSAISSGYLAHACKILFENLSKMPGDSRTQIAFFTYNSFLHYYQIQENSYKMLIWPDIEDVELPLSEDLLINLHERKDTILEFLENLPSNFFSSNDSGNCLGFVIQVAMKLIGHNGGRVTIINGSLPNVGPGQLKVREYKDGDLNTLQPATDFYKSLALQCANDQISVDLFCINRQYSDIASISAITRHSSGCFQYYGNFQAVTEENKLEPEEQLDFHRFCNDFQRYLTRKIGFEAVMRTRFTKGLDLTAFYGNLFMRSTNVIALPVVNPDNSYLIQFKINNSLSEWKYVIIQSALLYTSSNSDRRIRVHTMCLPISNRLEDIFLNANGSAISGLITKIAIDKCILNGFNNVREAFVNSLVDPLKVFNSMLNQSSVTKPLLCPNDMKFLAFFVLGLLRNPAFRGNAMNIDERMAFFEYLRSLPLIDILHRIYPYMVSVAELSENISLKVLANKTLPRENHLQQDQEPEEDQSEIDQFTYPTRLNLSSSVITRDGAFLMDTGNCFYLFLGNAVPDKFLKNCFSVNEISQLSKDYGLVNGLDLSNAVSKRILSVKRKIANRSLGTSIITVLPDCKMRSRILNYLVEDRMENSMSYFEFLKSIQSSVYS